MTLCVEESTLFAVMLYALTTGYLCYRLLSEEPKIETKKKRKVF